VPTFTPNHRHLIDAAYNRVPARMPLYDHLVDLHIIEAVLDQPVAELLHSTGRDLEEGMRRYNAFFVKMGYDACAFERCINGVLIGGGALGAHQPGCIKYDGRLQ
jgi:hypothetical protein